MSTQANRLAHSYLDAKQCVIEAGFAHEIDWQENIRFTDLTEERFLREYTWVVFSSGFREAVLRKKFDNLVEAFGGLMSASFVARNRSNCRQRALNEFGHRGKVAAVLDVCKMIETHGFQFLLEKVRLGGVEFIDQLPFIRPAGQPVSVMNHPPFVRMEGRSIPPLGERAGRETAVA